MISVFLECVSTAQNIAYSFPVCNAVCSPPRQTQTSIQTHVRRMKTVTTAVRRRSRRTPQTTAKVGGGGRSHHNQHWVLYGELSCYTLAYCLPESCSLHVRVWFQTVCLKLVSEKFSECFIFETVRTAMGHALDFFLPLYGRWLPSCADRGRL